jgi:hypothetical protein
MNPVLIVRSIYAQTGTDKINTFMETFRSNKV